MASRTLLKVTFSVAGGPAKLATGREGQSLIALVSAGPRGITSLETFKAGWAVRLGAYIFDLKKMGVPIVTTREPHDGGNHGRYSLSGPVTILSISGGDAIQQPLKAVA
ncbi:MAG: hypothetical protein ABIN69_07265 [Aestuariivirga sp.]